LDGLSPAQWFWQPSEGVTHVAWQAGHLAFAEYALCLRRLRGRTEADAELIPDDFIASFQKGSQPQARPADNPSLDEIRRVLDAVHRQTLDELAEFTATELNVPVERPHPVFDTKLGAVEWCSQHELVHAGQIALLRRLMGEKPLR